MGHTLRIDALGTTIAIDLSNVRPELAVAVREVWRDALAPDGSPSVAGGGSAAPAAVTDLTDPGRSGRDLDAPRHAPRHAAATVIVPDAQLEHALSALSSEVTLAAIEARRGELWMLHAAGLALPDGRVVALIGPSGRGKTTASRALGQTFGYVTDETVAIDPTGRVWPYRKPLSIIENRAAPKVQRAPSDAGLQPLPPGPLHLAAIVLLDRRDDDESVEPYAEPVALKDALEELVAQSSYLTAMPAPLQSMVRHTAAVGGVMRIVYREASTLPALIASLAAGPIDLMTPADVSVTQVCADPPGVAADSPDPGAIVRTAIRDAVALDDDDIAVLTVDAGGAGTLRVLSGIGPAVFAAASGASFEQLVDHVVAVHGVPADGDASQHVRVALDELVDAGILAVPAATDG